MSPREFTTQHERTGTETFIIAKTEDGFRIHSPGSPAKVYFVSGTPDDPTCTCLESQAHGVDPDWRCKHIQAVEARFWSETAEQEVADIYETEERAAIQEEARSSGPARKPKTPKESNGVSQMLLKRSVSPDGRIDSLSVEFAIPVQRLTVGEIRERAAQILGVQDGIVGGFKNRNGKPPAVEGPRPSIAGNGSVPATMVDIGGMNGKWGRRLFLNVQVNGETLKLFGNRKELADAIEAAGFSDLGDVEEGLNLNVPCRVTTKPSPDGRYTNIERVFPAARAPQTRSR